MLWFESKTNTKEEDDINLDFLIWFLLFFFSSPFSSIQDCLVFQGKSGEAHPASAVPDPYLNSVAAHSSGSFETSALLPCQHKQLSQPMLH